MEKLCVFCGEKPEYKNREHIIPQWLINLTGDPNRKIMIGRHWGKDGAPLRSFPFNQFTFPACTKCNSDFASLENHAREITVKILENKSISVFGLDIFLDWIDKIRIGLWLGMRYLNKNIFNITPNFHISHRIGSDDRMLLIYKSANYGAGVNFFGVDTPLFYHSPSCFYLRINQLFFFSMSYQYFLSRRLGFPYPEKVFYDDNGMMSSKFCSARRRIMHPIIQWPIAKGGISIFQSIWRNAACYQEVDTLYNNQYVKENALSFEDCIGWPYWTKENGFMKFPGCTGDGWIKLTEVNPIDLITTLGMQVLEYQNKIPSLASYEMMSKLERKGMEEGMKHSVNVNKIMIRDMKNAAKSKYYGINNRNL